MSRQKRRDATGKVPDLRRLPPALRRGLSAARRAASREGEALFLVGGAVRDLLLGRPVLDVDLALEGDGLAFGRALSRELGARLRAHERYGTATLVLEDGSRLDVATTRSETYEAPGALPRVSRAPLLRDLGRRDFTINAMAMRIAPGRPRRIDPFGGERDLERKLVRMLHPGSPMDDPTRAFRAVRYANRLGFRIERRTREWISDALRAGAFEAVSGDRLRRELALLFSEPGRARAVLLVSRLGLVRAIDPALPQAPAALSTLQRAEKLAGRHPGMISWRLFLLVWAGGLDREGARRLGDRLSMTGDEKRTLLEWPATLARLRAPASSGAQTAELAGRLSAEEIGAAAALDSGARSRRLERALAVRDTRLSVRGRDLLAAGVPAGPRVGRALQATLRALRDGRISRREELEFAIREALGEAS